MRNSLSNNSTLIGKRCTYRSTSSRPWSQSQTLNGTIASAFMNIFGSTTVGIAPTVRTVGNPIIIYRLLSEVTILE